MKRSNFWLLVLTVVMVFSGYRWQVQWAQRHRLTAQLLAMQQVVQAENAKAVVALEGMVKGIEASVAKNQNQPREVAVLRTCQALHRRTAALLDTLHVIQTSAFSQSDILPTRQYPAFYGASAHLMQPYEARIFSDRLLAKRFAAYHATLPAMLADSLSVTPTRLNGQPVIVALATIAEMESDLLSAEQKILRHFSGKVGAEKITKKLLAFATAESNVVRPGDTYRARLFLMKQLSLPHGTFQMKCNNQPIEVNPQGIGKVRFRAPNRLGPATWTGSIRFHINGRDTTFQVRVPYRVARR